MDTELFFTLNLTYRPLGAFQAFFFNLNNASMNKLIHTKIHKYASISAELIIRLKCIFTHCFDETFNMLCIVAIPILIPHFLPQ